MRKLKILMVAPTPFPGNRGTPSRILDMSQGLRRLGHDVHVVSYHLKTDTPTDGLRVHRIPKIRTYKKMGPGPSVQKLLVLDPLLSWKVWQVSKAIDFDIIHGHSYEGFLAAALTAKIRRKKLIYDAHSTLVGELPTYDFINIQFIMNLLDKKVPEWSDYVIAVSDTLKMFLEENKIPPEKISVIPTGVNIQQFEGHNPENVKNIYKITKCTKIVMYTGSLANFQGVDYLVEAMTMVFKDYKDAVLFLVGNTNEQRYKEMCGKYGISDKVIITGERAFEEIPQFLAAADILVSPRTECPSIPQKLSNYMAAGKAIVSFQGSAKIIEHEKTGIIVENENVKEMSESIIRLLKDEEQRNRLGSNAKYSLLGKYDWNTLAEKTECVYYKLLSDK